MGWLILLIVIVILEFFIIFVIIKDSDFLVLMIVMIFPLTIIISNIFGEREYVRFKVDYEMYQNVNKDSLSIDSKLQLYKDAQRLNKEIRFAQKYHSSFWNGWFTDERLTQYSLLE